MTTRPDHLLVSLGPRRDEHKTSLTALAADLDIAGQRGPSVGLLMVWLAEMYADNSVELIIRLQEINKMYHDKVREVMVQYDNSDDAMYGNDADVTEGINTTDSERKFESMLRTALDKRYPGADIFVDVGNGHYTANGAPDTLDAMEVGEIVNDVWSTFDWIVED